MYVQLLQLLNDCNIKAKQQWNALMNIPHCSILLVCLLCLSYLGVVVVVGRDNNGKFSNNELLNAIHVNDAALITEALKSLSKEEINMKGRGGQTPLMFSVLAGKENAVLPLLKAGADPNIGEKDGYTPIHGAAFQGRAAIAKILIEQGIEFTGEGARHQDGACWGAEQRHTDTVKVFLEAGMEKDFKSENGKSCMELCKENPMTVRLLRNFRRKLSGSSNNAKSKSQLKMEEIMAKRATSKASLSSELR